MQLQEIDKNRYRKHLNRIIVGFIASFTLLALVFGQALIFVFSTPEGDNFRFNLAGVLLALIVCGAILNKIKNSNLFVEVYYVWQLKQCQNQIYRKLKSIKKAASENDTAAIAILVFYYRSLKQVYELDDNTLTINNIISELNKSITLAEENNLDHQIIKLDKNSLKNF
ncbi:DUF3087 family protein [Thalassotalea agariperforans]